MNETPKPLPKLLLARHLHSGIFIVCTALLILVSEPVYSVNSVMHWLMLWTGYALIIFAVFGRIYCSSFIGGRKNEAIMRDGPFSVVRNPLYVFSFIATIGVGLQSGMFVVTALLTGAFMIYYPFVVAKEERYLSAKFGEEYANYVREVPRWVPNMKLWIEPAEAMCMPKYIRSTMADALVFFLAMPTFALLSWLYHSHLLVVWLNIW